MPDYCVTELKITSCSSEMMAEIKSFIKGEEIDGNAPIDFEKIVPHPEHIKPDTPDGHAWRIENWGTKWDAMDGRWENDTLIFTTAWHPPIPILLQLSKAFPSVTIEMEFGEDAGTFGKYKFMQGQIKSCQYEISDSWFRIGHLNK